MNPTIKALLLLLLFTSASLARDRIETLTLDPRVVVVVPVATNRVTTLSFPGPIAGIDGAGVSADTKTPEDFLVSHAKGSCYLALRALRAQASANVNVRWNKKTYVFELVESPEPVLCLNLEPPPASKLVAGRAPRPTVTALLSLLDKAKAFPLLREQHPDAVAGVEFRTFAGKTNVTDFGDFQIQLDEVYRFGPEDTLVFRATLRNRGGSLLEYRPDSFQVRAGARLYPQSVSDATGQVPAGAEAVTYFAITGTPDGGRNELSIENEFSVFVTRTSPAPPTDTP